MKGFMSSVLGFVVAATMFVGFSAQAKNRPGGTYPKPPVAMGAQNDSDLVRAVNDRRNVNFVEGHNVVVSRLLPDDKAGLPHQRWYVKLSNGAEVFAVYNIDLGQRIPMKIGDVMSLGGEFKMTNVGPLIHWLHYDPSGRRPDGYVEVNGVRYGSRK